MFMNALCYNFLAHSLARASSLPTPHWVVMRVDGRPEGALYTSQLPACVGCYCKVCCLQPCMCLLAANLCVLWYSVNMVWMHPVPVPQC